jgi:hypothetical protein
MQNIEAAGNLAAVEHGRMDIEILVEGEGLTEVETIRIPAGSTAHEIVSIVAAKAGYAVQEAMLFVEDCEQAVDLAIVVTEEAFGNKVHHVHRAHKIEVAIFYQGRKIEKRFAPSTRVQRVLDWAVGPNGFKIDPAIAPEMELALHGQTTALPKNAHIGRYVRHPHHELAFDLIRGIVPNGASL